MTKVVIGINNKTEVKTAMPNACWTYNSCNQDLVLFAIVPMRSLIRDFDNGLALPVGDPK